MSRRTQLRVETLELRAMLSSDGITTPANDHVCDNAPGNPNCAVIGDADRNGVFDSSDFIAVFTNGKFGTGLCAEWEDGDFNRDGVLDFDDLSFAFDAGQFEVPLELAELTFIPGLAGKTCAPGKNK